eukprot:Selendium_serpulae@DN6222_c0_g1_i3.p1
MLKKQLLPQFALTILVIVRMLAAPGMVRSVRIMKLPAHVNCGQPRPRPTPSCGSVSPICRILSFRLGRHWEIGGTLIVAVECPIRWCTGIRWKIFTTGN